MSGQRIFSSGDFLQISSGEPIRAVVTESREAVVVAWIVLQGQTIAAHVHPQGQDTWTVLSGRGEYRLDAQGATRSLAPGDIAVAPVGAVHGAFNPHAEPLIFVSVVTPADAGYRPL